MSPKFLLTDSVTNAADWPLQGMIMSCERKVHFRLLYHSFANSYKYLTFPTSLSLHTDTHTLAIIACILCMYACYMHMLCYAYAWVPTAAREEDSLKA